MLARPPFIDSKYQISKKNDVSEFVCSKCHQTFLGLDSFHGEYQNLQDGIGQMRLCTKCLSETMALLNGETEFIMREVRERIEECTRQHRIDKYADAKRIAYEEILDLLENHCILFNGNNVRCIRNRDLSTLERAARRIIHDEFKINCEEQIQLSGSYYDYTVDGLISTGRGKDVVLEYDGYWHGTYEQKVKDRHKDSVLTEEGYDVLRIPEHLIKNDKSQFKTLILDALYGVKHGSKKTTLQTQSPLSPVSPESEDMR